MRRTAILLTISLFASPWAWSAQAQAVIEVRGPTVIAFFPPVSEEKLDRDADTNEALSDFQLYASRVRAPLTKHGIEFHEIYATSFRWRMRGHENLFRPGEVQIGYFFIAPGKKPRVDYGVNTDDGILQSAAEYFGLAEKQETPQGKAASARDVPAPKLPYIDRGACPFEGCQYAVWTARKPAVVYDTWETGRKPIARLAKGDHVTGITGVVVTYKPGVIRMDRDFPQENLRRGDKILTYTYHGEGTSTVWVNGRFYKDFDVSFAKGPDGTGCGGDWCHATWIDSGKNVWWAELKLADGRIGWVNMNEAAFDGVDALG